jgi:protein-tyrosine phosphatase
MSQSEARMRVLFVCLGNICRSPMAEGVFRHHLRAADLADAFRHDSAGTGHWHVGSPPDHRAVATCRARGVTIDDLRARQVRPADFRDFDLILAMDRDNLTDLRALAFEHAARDAATRVELFRSFDPQGEGDVPDPYSGGREGFERVFDMVDRTTANLLATLRERSTP